MKEVGEHNTKLSPSRATADASSNQVLMVVVVISFFINSRTLFQISSAGFIRFLLPGCTDFLPGTEDYTFERFVVGSSNKFAHAAARLLYQKSGRTASFLGVFF